MLTTGLKTKLERLSTRLTSQTQTSIVVFPHKSCQILDTASLSFEKRELFGHPYLSDIAVLDVLPL